MDLDNVGTWATAGSIIFSAGVGFTLLRGQFGKVISSMRDLSERMSEQITVTAEVTRAQSEVVRLLVDLKLVHTPERADGAGFGTVQLREQIAEILHRLELLEVKLEAHHEKQVADHDKIISHIKGEQRG